MVFSRRVNAFSVGTAAFPQVALGPLGVFRHELIRTLTLGRIATWLAMSLFPPTLIGIATWQMGARAQSINADQLYFGYAFLLFILIPQVTTVLGMLLWATPDCSFGIGSTNLGLRGGPARGAARGHGWQVFDCRAVDVFECVCGNLSRDSDLGDGISVENVRSPLATEFPRIGFLCSAVFHHWYLGTEACHGDGLSLCVLYRSDIVDVACDD